MDGTYGAWRARFGVPPGTAPELGCKFVLTAGGGGTFDLYRYVQAQYGSAACFADRLPAMSGFVTAYLTDQGAVEKLQHPERTLKSYVLQEAEAISRCEKLRWAEAAGRLPVNLQHDGLLVQLWSGDDRVEVARSLERLSTAVLGYDQPVAHKAWD